MPVHFVLKRFLPGFEEYGDLYEAIKTGKKTVEYRDATEYWAKRLLNEGGMKQYLEYVTYTAGGGIRFSYFDLKHHTATFRVGYTKGPTLLADIDYIIWDLAESQFEVHLKNVKEVS